MLAYYNGAESLLRALGFHKYAANRLSRELLSAMGQHTHVPKNSPLSAARGVNTAYTQANLAQRAGTLPAAAQPLLAASQQASTGANYLGRSGGTGQRIGDFATYERHGQLGHHAPNMPWGRAPKGAPLAAADVQHDQWTRDTGKHVDPNGTLSRGNPYVAQHNTPVGGLTPVDSRPRPSDQGYMTTYHDNRAVRYPVSQRQPAQEVWGKRPVPQGYQGDLPGFSRLPFRG